MDSPRSRALPSRIPASTSGQMTGAPRALPGGRDPVGHEDQQGRLALSRSPHLRTVGGRSRAPCGAPSRRNRSSSGPTARAASPSTIPTWSRRVMSWTTFSAWTPTDIVGQHIHLVKFDVTSSDGSAMAGITKTDASPEEVNERIKAINGIGGSWNGAPGNLQAKAHPYFGVLGATMAQRRYADPTLNLGGNGPHAPHRVHSRSLRALHTPAGRAVCRPGDRARGIAVAISRDRPDHGQPLRRRPNELGCPTFWRVRAAPTAIENSCWNSPITSSPTGRTAPQSTRRRARSSRIFR